ncbi:hypothetical protein ACQ7HM_09115 [Williamsia sp. MIQD14]|uniref:hypothetical protein n=1 Tax=Williamsia sp. MIQD14 TaxID=3425703 RepID=UPI003DA1B95C
MMHIRLTAAITVAAATLLTVTSCSSGSSADAPSQPQVQSISLAPGVVKDSPADLNSTKDMSDVVDTTTMTPPQSPYYGHLPAVCPLLEKVSFSPIRNPTLNTGLNTEFAQSCVIQGPGFSADNLGVTLIAQSVSATLAAQNVQPIEKDFRASGIPTPVTTYSLRSSPEATGACVATWGQFYGSVQMSLFGSGRTTAENCQLVLEFAKAATSNLPKAPFQMRATGS